MKKWVILLSICLSQGFTAVVLAQSKYDSSYVVSYKKRLLLRAYVAERKLAFSFFPVGNSNLVFRLHPNIRTTMGIGFNYRRISYSFSVPIRPAAASEEKYGRSKYSDMQINYYGGKWCGDLYYQRYQGYYINNPRYVFNGWDEKQYPLRQDVSAFHAGVNGYIVFNHRRFSLKAAFNQTQKQLRSAGSPLFMASVSVLRLHNDSSLIPVRTTLPVADKYTFENGRFYTLSVLPGYAYHYVRGNFFISSTALIGGGMQLQHYQLNGREKEQLRSEVKAVLRMVVGYSTRHLFTGVHGILDMQTAPVHNIRLISVITNARWTVGYRF